MLRSLLADRFHLKVTRRTQPLSAYALSLDKKGDTSKLAVSRPNEIPNEEGGATTSSTGNLNAEIRFTANSMTQFVTRLSFYLRRTDPTPILDRTGLTGTYNFSLPKAQEMGGGAEAPSVFTAIKEIGLRLEKGQHPVEVIVVESVDAPDFEN